MAWYWGTGSLLVSASPNGPLLASHEIAITECALDRGAWVTGNVGPFSVVAIGDACTMWDFKGGGDTFRPDPGTVCTLEFPDGGHVIRITDFVGRYGPPWAHAPNMERRSYLEVALGGDDATTGRHVLYRFSGNGRTADATETCEQLWAKNPNKANQVLPAATEQDAGEPTSWAWGH